MRFGLAPAALDYFLEQLGYEAKLVISHPSLLGQTNDLRMKFPVHKSPQITFIL